MKILCKILQKDWSWGLVIDDLIDALPEFDFIKSLPAVVDAPSDVYFVQQVTILNRIPFKYHKQTIVRLGANRTFDDKFDYREMGNCFAIVATNKNLYGIGKEVNENTVLIPNGLNLDKWKVTEKPKQFTVGFAGNVHGYHYRDYKGYDLIVEACKKAGVELKTAFYRQRQIPHDKMREEFYSKISCLLLPTSGEGCSNVLMESLSCGVPVLTTKEAGFHGELLEDSANCLFIKRDVEDISEKIKRLKVSNRLREKLSKNGRAFAEKHHNINKVAEQYKQLFIACHKGNLKDVERVREETEKIVTVKVLQNIYDDAMGFLKHGTVIDMSYFRAKQLGNIVEIVA